MLARGATLALALVATWVLPAGRESLRAQPPETVVVIETTRARPYELALDGLRAALGTRAEIVVETVDPSDPAATQRVMAHAPRVIVPLGSQATAWALQQTRDVPIVFAMVLNPVASGLVESMERPGGRVTGASLDIPLGLHFRTLREVVKARRVAVLFNPRETGAIVEAAGRFAKEEGVELVPIEVASARELEGALDRVDHSFDALWSVADRTVFSQGAVERVLLHTFERRIPFMGLSEQYVRAGALLALSTSYDENGRKAGQLVQRVLSGSSAGGLSVAVPERVEVVFNPRTAKRLELEVPESQLARMSLTN